YTSLYIGGVPNAGEKGEIVILLTAVDSALCGVLYMALLLKCNASQTVVSTIHARNIERTKIEVQNTTVQRGPFGGSKGDFGNEINNQLYGTTEGGVERGGGGLNEENRDIPNGGRFRRELGSDGFNGEGRRGNGGIGSEGTGGEFNNRGRLEGGNQGRGFGGGPVGGEFNRGSLEGGNFGGPRGQIPSDKFVSKFT
uniref:Uncharacterized protein n=1 Tax=Meloidogyne javanica TaxID=6303 RepID=A0A915LC41_MELJA